MRVYSKTFPRNTPSFKSNHLRAWAVSRTEDASGAAVGCFWHGTPLKMRPVGRRLSTVCGSAVLRDFEDASRTTEGCFWHRISLPYRKRLFFTPNASENASRTPGSLFEHGTHIPYRRWPSPVLRTILTRSTSYINLTSIARKRINIILIFV